MIVEDKRSFFEESLIKNQIKYQTRKKNLKGNMLGRSKLTIFFIYFLYFTSLILFLSILTVFLILTIINFNSIPLFLNTNEAIKFQFYLIFYVTLICLTCYFCFIFTRTIHNYLYSLAINRFIVFGLISVCSILITYFLNIKILRNENVLFRVFDKNLVEKKLKCSFSGGEPPCYEVLRFIYKGISKRLFYGNLIVFVLISINLGFGSILLIKEQDNTLDSDIKSLRTWKLSNSSFNEEEGGFRVKKSKKHKES